MDIYSIQWAKLQCLTEGFPSVHIRKESETFGRNHPSMKIKFAVVSGSHFRIDRIKEPGRTYYTITDVSTNGTYVNNEPLGRNKRIEIKLYDEISILRKGVEENINYIFIPYEDLQEEKINGGPQSEYDFMDLCGSGNFAVVRKVREKKTDKIYAMKIIDKEKAEGISARPSAIKDECNILIDLNHENIVSLHELYETPKYIYMVLELMTGGELFDQIVEESHLTEERCQNIMKQLFSALEYLHSKSIIHRDLKPENILCESKESDVVKITDFGLSRIISKESLAKTMCGTPLYVAPEILTGKEYNASKIDVWSCGVILYVMACGFPPFSGSDDDGNRKLFDNIQHANYEFRSPYWDDKSDELKDLISKMLVVDIDRRYSIEECMNHPFMRKNYGDVGNGWIAIQQGRTSEREQRKRFMSEVNFEEVPVLERSKPKSFNF